MDYLHYKGYHGSVEYSKEDECLCGQVLGLKDSLIVYEGNTLAELIEDFEAGIDSYLSGCEEHCIFPETSLIKRKISHPSAQLPLFAVK